MMKNCDILIQNANWNNWKSVSVKLKNLFTR